MRYCVFKFLIILTFLTACSSSDDPKIAFDKGDYEKSLVLWEARAKDNDAEAQNYIGIQYFLGLGVEQDYQEAKKWYELAAKNGLVDAQFNLGLLYDSNKLGSPDHESAYLWLYAAHRQGNKKAEGRLAGIVSGLGAPKTQELHLLAEQYIINDVIDNENSN